MRKEKININGEKQNYITSRTIIGKLEEHNTPLNIWNDKKGIKWYWIKSKQTKSMYDTIRHKYANHKKEVIYMMN